MRSWREPPKNSRRAHPSPRRRLRFPPASPATAPRRSIPSRSTRCSKGPMHYFDYRNGALFAEDVAVSELAKAVGTPFYVYSAATIRRHFRVFSQAFAGLDTLVCYAMKANSNQAVLRLLAKEGAGMDVVSGGELARALAAGVKGEKITFSGVGKTDDEIAAALDAGIFCFNVE